MSLDNNIYHEIDRLRAQYQTNKTLFISSSTIASLLKKLGSTDKELEEIKRMSDSLEEDPTLNFRRSRSGCFVFNPQNQEIYRTEFQKKEFILMALTIQ